MGIVVLGAVFVDIKGYPSDVYIPGGRNAGRVEQMHGGVSRNIVEDIANVELQPTFIGLVDDTGAGADVVRKLKAHKVNTDYIRVTKDGMGTWLAIFDNGGDVDFTIAKEPRLTRTADGVTGWRQGGGTFKLIPYYKWCRRATGRSEDDCMAVWFRQEDMRAEDELAREIGENLYGDYR